MRALVAILAAGCAATPPPSTSRGFLAAAWPAPEPRRARPAPTSLTVELAVTLAREAHPLPGALAARVAAADAEVAAEILPEGPQLRVESLRLRERPDGAGADLRVALRVEPPHPLERPALAAAARARADGVRAEAAAEWHEVETRVRRAFWHALLSLAEARQTADLLAARSAASAIARRRAAQGVASKVEVAYAELDESEAAVENQTAAAGAEAARRELLLLVGLPEADALALDGDPLDPALWPAIPSDDALREVALARRADLAAAAAVVDEADAELRGARARRWPWLDFVEVGYEIEPDLTAREAFVFSAALRLPVFEWAGAGVTHAREARRAANATLGATARIVADDLRARAAVARAARRVLADGADSGALERARRAVAEAAAAGQLDPADAAEIDVRAARALRDRLRRARSFFEALEDLREAAGGDLTVAP